MFAQEVPKIVGAERTIEMDEQVVKEIRTEGEKPIIDRKFIIAPGLLKMSLKQDIAGIPSNILAINILIESNYGI